MKEIHFLENKGEESNYFRYKLHETEYSDQPKKKIQAKNNNFKVLQKNT
jgi:hypothetical protein